MTSALASTTAAARRLVLVQVAADRRADDAVRRFRLARRRLEGPEARDGRATPRSTPTRR
jgi:hypothetical protein